MQSVLVYMEGFDICISTKAVLIFADEWYLVLVLQRRRASAGVVAVF